MRYVRGTIRNPTHRDLHVGLNIAMEHTKSKFKDITFRHDCIRAEAREREQLCHPDDESWGDGSSTVARDD